MTFIYSFTCWTIVILCCNTLLFVSLVVWQSAKKSFYFNLKKTVNKRKHCIYFCWNIWCKKLIKDWTTILDTKILTKLMNWLIWANTVWIIESLVPPLGWPDRGLKRNLKVFFEIVIINLYYNFTVLDSSLVKDEIG